MEARFVTWKNGGCSLYLLTDDGVTYICSFPREFLFHTHTLWPGGQWMAGALNDEDCRKLKLKPEAFIDEASEKAMNIMPDPIPDWARRMIDKEVREHQAQRFAEAALSPPKRKVVPPPPTRETVVIEDKRTFKQLLRDFIGRY